jgi:hypothetical protein
MNGRKKVREIRQEGTNCDILEPEEGIPELFVDGSVGIAMSAGVVKVDLFVSAGSVEEDGVQIDQRLLKYRLAMPMVAWVEFCANSMASMRSQKEELLQVIDEGRAKVAHALGEPQDKPNGND